MSHTIAHLLVDILHAAGVRRIYGVAGDSLNGITDALRSKGTIDWIHTRHEETAAFAAGAEAHLTGSLAGYAGSCGPGNLHQINGLFDCHRSHVPMVQSRRRSRAARSAATIFKKRTRETCIASAATTASSSAIRRIYPASSRPRSASRSRSAASRSSCCRAMRP